jgi:tRNA threonylcarbamoyladenosine biosynthesis protein TsaB
LTDGGMEVLGQTRLEGRTYSATLVAAIGDLLKAHGAALGEIRSIVVVNGPGSFTGVRVGLSAAKGLAEGAGLRLVALSRLEVLAAISGCENAALDAHRHEVFLRVGGRELLAGAGELAAMVPAPERIAVCDDDAAELIGKCWPGTRILRVAAPTAADAMRQASPRICAGEFDDVAPIDGHYLRRSDAEIFGASGQ